eukprot:GFKZ01010114.1.p1 GENE.GFKZ01010114.1~~GFKZ01010114.1.p1  ORF type:complete len:1193 (-),score=162.98 GFKZ01010114.1:275-3853(-)
MPSADGNDHNASPKPPPQKEKRAIELPPGLDSGDIVLFNRRCTSMAPAGAVLCAVAKIFSNSQWDHVGVVIRDTRTGELLFLEADFGGVKLRSLEERVRRSKSNEIAIRKLSVVRSSSMREKFFQFAEEMQGRPYDLGTGPVMVRVTDPLAKKERERLSALLIDKKAQIEEIDLELKTAALTNFQKRLLHSERVRVEQDCEKINVRLQKELEVNSSIEPTEQGSFVRESSDLSRVFCSELVAASYQQVGLLESYPPAFYYAPKDMSSEQQNPPGVHLLKGARLSKEIYLRRKMNAVTDLEDMRNLRSFRGVVENDTPSRASRKLIKDALKRTPIYSMVPDEYKRSHLVKSFRARIIEPGDIVFEQGAYGDKMYVIGYGELERFMSKGGEDPLLTSTMGPRTAFGLTAFTFNCPRVSTIRAKEKTLLWELDRPTFELFKDASGDIRSIVSNADSRSLRRILQEHFLFSRLDRLGPNEMSPFFIVKFRAGETVFEQGDTGDNFYIIKSGEVERYIRHPKLIKNGDQKNGKDRGEEESLSLSKTLKEGQSFGELSLMYNAPRAATVRARTDVECWAISAESFHRLSLGGGTQYLRAVFNQNASVMRGNEAYMTRDDLLKFAGVHAFPEEDRERLAALLVSLVTSNRERDPISRLEKSEQGGAESSNQNGSNEVIADSAGSAIEDEEGVLMDFWEFVRFDIVLNQPAAEMNFAFRLADQCNSGFISLDDMQSLLQLYAGIDETAKKMLTTESGKLKKVFGRDGSRLLSGKEFQELSNDILPPLFRQDVSQLTEHMLNIDLENTDVSRGRGDDLSFVEPDGELSVIGSQFMAYSSRAGSQFAPNVHMYTGTLESSNVPKWIPAIDWSRFLSVGVAGALTRTAVAPLDRLKILMQTGGLKNFSNGWISATRQMFRQDESFLKAMFRGNGANVLRIVPNAAIQLLVVKRLSENQVMRRLMSESERSPTLAGHGSQNSETNVRLVSGGTKARAVEAVLIGGIAGMVGATATYPLDFIRGRLTLQRNGFEVYRGALHGISEAIRKEGVGSVYRGLVPTLLGVFPYVGISFAMYETLRPILPRKNDGSGLPTTGSSIACGAIAAATGQFAAFPLDTCRRRMQVAGFDSQTSATSTTFRGMWREIGREMGLRGYFRGILPNLFKALPASAVSFVAYEHVRESFTSVEATADRFFKQSANRVRT